jgi:hypothetical protein
MPLQANCIVLRDCAPEILIYESQFGTFQGLTPFASWIDDLLQNDAESIRLDETVFGLRLAEKTTANGATYTLLYLAVEQPPSVVWVAVQLVQLDIASFQKQLLMSNETIGRINKAISYVVNYCLSLIGLM